MKLPAPFLSFLQRSARSVCWTCLTAAVLSSACESNQFCTDAACSTEDGEGGEAPTGGKKSSGESPTGGKKSSGGSHSGGATGSGGKSLGGAAGAEASGGRPEGSGGMAIDPGELDGSVNVELLDILSGGSAEVEVSLERSGGFKGTVLVSLAGEPQFSGTQVFAAADEDEATLTIEATGAVEQGYYDAMIIAESADGVLRVEIPLSIRVRGAPGTLDLTFGDRESPWFDEGTEVEVAVDDAGFVYLKNQETIFRFDPRGQLDESFEPEGLGDELGPMIGMEDGVLVASDAENGSTAILNIMGDGGLDSTWAENQIAGRLLQMLPSSLSRRDDRIVVVGPYAYNDSYPWTALELMSSTGVQDTVFRDTSRTTGSIGSAGTPIAHLDSEGRLIVAPDLPGEALRRILPDGRLDEAFGEAGSLHLAGDAPTVLDFQVLSDDSLAILVRDSTTAHLAIWTPSETGGVVQYHSLGESSFTYHALVRVLGDELILIADNNGRFSYNYYAKVYSRHGILNPSFGDNGEVHLQGLCEEHYGDLESDPCSTPQAVAFDPSSNRLIGYGQSRGSLYSIWL